MEDGRSGGRTLRLFAGVPEIEAAGSARPHKSKNYAASGYLADENNLHPPHRRSQRCDERPFDEACSLYPVRQLPNLDSYFCVGIPGSALGFWRVVFVNAWYYFVALAGDVLSRRLGRQ